MMKICEVCAGEFEAKRPTAMYCSAACRQYRYRHTTEIDERRPPLSVRLDDRTYTALRVLAAMLGVSPQDIVRMHIDQLIDMLARQLSPPGEGVDEFWAVVDEVIADEAD
jgi:hypothetical protein